jgi:hypothetical protein
MARPVREADELPLYLKGAFVFFKGDIAGKNIVWAKLVDEAEVTPDRLQKQKTQLEQFFHALVVFVFDNLDSWQRKRLIEKRVGFVQIGKQVYIPEMLLQLSDIRSKLQVAGKPPGSLSFPAQAALLYHLQRTSLNRQSPQQIATALGYSTMTVTRIVRELQQLGLISIHPGKEKSFTFNKGGKDLWLLALPSLRNPVKEEWFSYGPLGITNLFETGETALANYSMLAESRVIHLAIGKEQFRSLRTLNRLPELNKNQGNYRLEVWNYDPGIVVAPGHNTVDKLSLSLSMTPATDERIIAALEEMINHISW